MKLDNLKRMEEYMSYVLFLGGVSVCLFGIFMRYIVNMPQSWIMEIFEILMVWSIFIGFGTALRDNRHIAIDLVYDKLSYPLKRICSVVSNGIGAGYSFFLTTTGIKMVALSYKQQNVTLDVGMPMWITYLIMPIGMGLLGVYFTVKCYQAIKGNKEEILGQPEHEQYLNVVEN